MTISQDNEHYDVPVDFSKMKGVEFELHGLLNGYTKNVMKYIQSISLAEGFAELIQSPETAKPRQEKLIEAQQRLEKSFRDFDSVPEQDRSGMYYATDYDHLNIFLDTAEVMVKRGNPLFKTTTERRFDIDPVYRSKIISDLQDHSRDV